jgi:hypothetical protein
MILRRAASLYRERIQPCRERSPCGYDSRRHREVSSLFLWHQQHEHRGRAVDLPGKPIAESSALCIPTGVQPFPGGHSHVYRFISGATRVLPQGPRCAAGRARRSNRDVAGADGWTPSNDPRAYLLRIATLEWSPP